MSSGLKRTCILFRRRLISFFVSLLPWNKLSLDSILNLNKNKALIQLEDGIKLQVSTKEIKHYGNLPTPPQTKIQIQTPQNANVVLDLHGLRADEAIEKLEVFISNSLIAGFDEVLIYHGIGTGRLSSIVRDFLKSHPKVVDFTDAPAKMGGFGAKIVKL